MAGDSTRARPPRSSLAKEIGIVLAVKAAALCLLWLAFFSSPAAPRLGPGGVGQALLAPAGKPAHPQKSDHAARPPSR
jgi:hypothetical protein